MTRPTLTKAKLRAGAILAALRNGKTLDLKVDRRYPCVQLPGGCERVRLALKMIPNPRLRVSGLGLHADISRYGAKDHVIIPWHAIVEWRSVAMWRAA